MNYKRIFILLLILPFILLSLPGCDSSRQEEAATPPQQEEASPQQQEQPITQPQEMTPPSAPSPPIELQLGLSHAPKVGEKAELTLVVINNYLPASELGNIRAWLEFSWTNTVGSYQESKQQIEIPPEEVLASGDLNWEGMLTSGTPLEFQTDIRFPKEGIWEITGYIEGAVGRIRSNRTDLAVDTERAGIFSGSATTPEWMKDYSPAKKYIPDSPNSKHPLIAKLDLSEPPRLGEPVELSWSVASIYDLENVRVWTRFKLLKPGSLEFEEKESQALLVEGDLQWEGLLEKDINVFSSAIVKFPSKGDWHIVLLARDSKGSYSVGDNIYLNVTEERGRWGWAEPHERDWSNVPPPPRVTDEEIGR